MAIDIRLRRIIPKAAGTYFIVRDNSQVAELEAENKMRLMFINVEQGPVNVAVSFAKGDKTGFQSIFGKATRAMRKAGNFSIDTCLDALEAGPITVINLRKFTNDHKAGVSFFNTSTSGSSIDSTVVTEIPYRKLFHTNTFWTPNYNALNEIDSKTLLQFGNVGKTSLSVIVTKSKTLYKTLTNEGEKSLKNTELLIEEFPALIDNPAKIKDTMVDVWLFNNNFEDAPDTNRYYGECFENGYIKNFETLEKLATIPESGFVKTFTGSLIPNLKSETGNPISINDVINQNFMSTGLICDLNEDVLELDYSTENNCFETYGTYLYDFNNLESEFVSAKGQVPARLLSHPVLKKIPFVNEIKALEPAKLTDATYKIDKTKISKLTVGLVHENAEDIGEDGKKGLLYNKFRTAFEYGLNVGDVLLGNSNIPVEIIGIEEVAEPKKFKFNKTSGEPTQEDSETDAEHTKSLKYVTYICSGRLDFDNHTFSKENKTGEIIVLGSILEPKMKPVSMRAVDVTENQYISKGADSRKQEEILDMMNDPGIVRGIIGLHGIRYVVDCFKSYVESGYKSQYGKLMQSLDEANKFVRTIANEPFIEDFMKSIDPLFKTSPEGAFDLSFLQDGGNKVYSPRTLSKPTIGGEYVFFFGPGYKKADSNTVTYPLAGKISNLFYLKENAFDVVANESGIVDGISQLEYNFDDVERMYLEKFLYNAVIRIGSQMRIFQNLTAYPKRTSMQQIHNSELLAYIKENLNTLAKNEAFKKGTYDDYLRVEVECKDFMQSLALAGAIESNPVVICSEKNNTAELRKQKIKLIHIEYTPLDALDKVVFDLNIN